MSFDLTELQDKAVAMAKTIADTRDTLPAIGILGGYAGTGKTTTLKEIVKLLQCVLLAPTGKAAVRITQVSGVQASTIHRWLYKVEVDEKTGALEFYRKPLDEMHVPPSRLVVVDEASMLSREVWDDLYEVCGMLRCNILLIGDAFQLPPISKDPKDAFSVFAKDFKFTQKVMLTEILRQAAQNPIIRISKNIRLGHLEEAFEELSILVSQDEFDEKLEETIRDQGMVICYTNEMRHHLNKYYRHKAGLTALQIGEPLLVLKNNYKINIFNGETFMFEGRGDSLGKRTVYDAYRNHEEDVNFFLTTFGEQNIILGEQVIAGEREKLGPGAVEQAVEYYAEFHKAAYLHCNYGYTLTCHKAQGHQADKVLVAMQPSVQHWKEEGRRWLYTAITRTQNEVHLFHVDNVKDLPIGLTK
jgi:exodeoxyribonuclease-5